MVSVLARDLTSLDYYMIILLNFETSTTSSTRVQLPFFFNFSFRIDRQAAAVDHEALK